MMNDISDPVLSRFSVKYVPTDGSSNFIKSVNTSKINEGHPTNVFCKTSVLRKTNFLEILLSYRKA